MQGLIAVILTYNEAPNLRRCLESVRGLCPIYVVDSGSTDATVALAQEYGAVVQINPYQNHATQWQWALEHLPPECQWVLALDADFAVSQALTQQIRQRLHHLPEQVAGIYVRHFYHFGGGKIRFGGTKHYWLRLVRRDRARADLSDLVDFRFIVQGSTQNWTGCVEEYNVHDDDLSLWLAKQDKFALRLAVEEELRRRRLLGWQGQARLWGNPDQRIMWLRDRWLHLPLFLRPVLYFGYRYFLMGGWLDGRAGFLYHFLQGFWLRVAVDWKIRELRQLALDDTAIQAFRTQMLTTRTGSVRQVYATLAPPTP